MGYFAQFENLPIFIFSFFFSTNLDLSKLVKVTFYFFLHEGLSALVQKKNTRQSYAILEPSLNCSGLSVLPCTTLYAASSAAPLSLHHPAPWALHIASQYSQYSQYSPPCYPTPAWHLRQGRPGQDICTPGNREPLCHVW